MADVDAPRRPGTPPRANIATGHPPHAPAPPGVLARTGRPHPPSSALEVCTSMPEKAVVEKAKRDLKQGKSPSTAAGEFVHEEIEHVREGKHGARSAKQAIAIGLSKARRAGVPLPAPEKGQTSESTRRAAKRELATAQGRRSARPTSRKRSRATRQA